MSTEIINWIDKKLGDVSAIPLFSVYFKNTELEKIEDAFYLTNRQHGIGIVLDNDLNITSVHLYAESYQDSHAFKGELPFNIKFSFDRKLINEILGKPQKNGGGQKNPYLDYIPIWDKYYFDSYSLHIQYSVNKMSIDMITIASLKLEEYFISELQ